MIARGNDHKLERLKAAADQSATQGGKPYCVANLNMAGARLLIVRPLSEFADDPERIVYKTGAEND